MRGYRSEGLLDEFANAERVLVAAGISRWSIDPRSLCRPTRSARSPTRSARPSPTWCGTPTPRHCWITLRPKTARAVLEVRDDGRGGLAPEGSGLSGMRERLQQVAGTLERDGRQDGTRLRDVAAAPSQRRRRPA